METIQQTIEHVVKKHLNMQQCDFQCDTDKLQLRRLKGAASSAKRRASETTKQKRQRNRNNALAMAQRRATETPEQAAERRRKNAERQVIRRANLSVSPKRPPLLNKLFKSMTAETARTQSPDKNETICMEGQHVFMIESSSYGMYECLACGSAFDRASLYFEHIQQSCFNFYKKNPDTLRKVLSIITSAMSKEAHLHTNAQSRLTTDQPQQSEYSSSTDLLEGASLPKRPLLTSERELPEYLSPQENRSKIQSVKLPKLSSRHSQYEMHQCWECGKMIVHMAKRFLDHFKYSYECRWCSYVTTCKLASVDHVIRVHADDEVRANLQKSMDLDSLPIIREEAKYERTGHQESNFYFAESLINQARSQDSNVFAKNISDDCKQKSLASSGLTTSQLLANQNQFNLVSLRLANNEKDSNLNIDLATEVEHNVCATTSTSPCNQNTMGSFCVEKDERFRTRRKQSTPMKVSENVALPPADFSCFSITESSLLVGWNPPTQGGVTNYRLVFQGSGGRGSTDRLLDPNCTMIRLTGLSPNSIYVVRLYTVLNGALSHYKVLYRKTKTLKEPENDVTITTATPEIQEDEHCFKHVDDYLE